MMTNKIIWYVEDSLHKLIISEIINQYCLMTQNWNFQRNFQIYIAKNNGDVIKNIMKINTVCIGLIDKDKKLPSNIDQFSKCSRDTETRKFEVNWVNENSNDKYLFILNPGPEKWLENCAGLAGISRAKYGIPEKFDDYKKLCKSSKPDERIVSYVKAIIQQSPSPVNLLFKGILKLHNYYKY